MIIRPFQSDDAPVLTDIFHASVHKAATRDYSREQVMVWSPVKPKPESYLERAKERIVFVAEDDSRRLIGYGDMELNGHIDHLYISPDHIGIGVGTAIYSAIEEAARKKNITTLFVEASESAISLFKKQGFDIISRHDFIIDNVSIHNYRMSKQLAYHNQK